VPLNRLKLYFSITFSSIHVVHCIVCLNLMNIMFLSLNILSKSRFNLFKFIHCVAYFEFSVYYYCYIPCCRPVTGDGYRQVCFASACLHSWLVICPILLVFYIIRIFRSTPPLLFGRVWGVCQIKSGEGGRCSMSATRQVFWPKALGCRPESLACWSAFF